MNASDTTLNRGMALAQAGTMLREYFDGLVICVTWQEGNDTQDRFVFCGNSHLFPSLLAKAQAMQEQQCPAGDDMEAKE